MLEDALKEKNWTVVDGHIIETTEPSRVLAVLMQNNAPIASVRKLLKSHEKCDLETPQMDIFQGPLLLFACHLQNEDYVRALLDFGANMDAENAQGTRVLHLACQLGCFRIAEFLLERGANAKLIHEATKQTPLHSAFNNVVERKHIQQLERIVKLLLQRGVDINAQDLHGATALAIACRKDWHHPIVKLLLECGARHDLIVQTYAPIVFAVGSNAIKSVEYLLQAGADPNQPVNGANLLCFALQQKRSTAMIQLLCKAGTDVDFKLRDKTKVDPPLYFALNFGNKQLTTLLLRFGADRYEPNHGGYNLTVAAMSTKKEDIAQMLMLEDLPEALTEEELQMKFIFSFCAQCRAAHDDEDLMACAGCGLVAYCKGQCQKDHWTMHKPICKQKRAATKLALMTENSE